MKIKGCTRKIAASRRALKKLINTNIEGRSRKKKRRALVIAQTQPQKQTKEPSGSL
jgi:hypothetical protein